MTGAVFRRLTGLCLVASLAGCGGGGGDLGGVDSGGTGSFAVGPISGFGSVIVNDIRYDDSQARVITDEGSPRTAADLKLGMVVEIEGSALSVAPPGAGYNRGGQARVIRFGPEIVGPLQNVDAAVSQIRVLGQVVDVTPTTVYGDDITGGLVALGRLPPGSALEVHGYLNTSGPGSSGAVPSGGGRYTATRIDRPADRRGDAEAYELQGVVRELDAGARRFLLGTARVDYSGLDEGQVRAAGIVEGARVRVRVGNTPRADGTWVMLQASAATRALGDRDDVEIEGLVTAFVSQADFSVDGIPVDGSGAEFDDDPARLAVGARVEVEGRLRGGVLIAREVDIEDDGSSTRFPGERRISLSGKIEAIDVSSQSFRLRGVTVDYSRASFDDGDAGDLRVGVEVEVDGRLSADGARLEAIEVEFDD